jgi:ABC-2 type transport system ATP-binding protein
MIEVKHLSRRYGELLAVDNLSFRVEPGEVLGFLGPNGAGKTTTMRMIAGFLAPSAGSIEVMGTPVSQDSLASRQCMGYLPEGAPVYPEMRVGRFLEFIAKVRGLRGAWQLERLRYVSGRLSLDGVWNKPIDTLSKGFRRRVGLAQAILHDPAVLILDEPTDGLDPNQKHEVRELIREMAHDKIIIVSTHILEEVHAVCSRAMIIARGRLLADDTPDALRARSVRHNAVVIEPEPGSDLPSGLDRLPGVAGVELGADQQCLTVLAKSGQRVYTQVADFLREKQVPVRSLHVEQGHLDDVFRRITADAEEQV